MSIRQLRLQTGRHQIDFEEADPRVIGVGCSLPEQDRAVVDPEVAPKMTVLEQMAGDTTVPTAQVEHACVGLQLIKRTQHTRLQALAGLGEWLAERLVE